MNRIKLKDFSIFDFVVKIDNEHKGLKQEEVMVKAEKAMIQNIKELVKASHNGSVEIEVSNGMYAGFTVACLVEHFTKDKDHDIRTHTYMDKWKSFKALLYVDNWPLRDRKIKEEK